MDNYQSLNHSKWECKYHVVFIPKYRRKALYFELRRHLGGIFRALTQQKESAVEEGTSCPITCTCCCRFRRNMRSRKWLGSSRGRARSTSLARSWSGSATLSGSTSGREGYFVSTVGRDEEVIRKYIREQEIEDKRVDQLNLV
jgi:putative transposase